MGKFSRNSEYTFSSFDEMIADIVEHFDEGMDIDILATWEETEKFITALISTGRFIPFDIDYAYPEINGYEKEYTISLTNSVDGNLMFVEPAYSENSHRYLDSSPECTDIVFISQDVSMALYSKYVEEEFRTVLFDFE